ncbi:KN motif and ankyrin repeat domain-containing protein 4 isoform X1 [Colossoma macropomum]|uniref:KN motif and ankyrin repeat domain-containing protein 4 isoform X1 n=1 Tax=Colossoma macropomum TaxID=42526 RepID=UPI001863FE67|nr:KN motif and ankyrin repeat domain-containing protein 4 isoform X1 [Colossoma macropomum]XP_036426070.1 KN motif and ankyrin repeat domain-containing protein 4 isoform X1 [Colossoma macropomum]XP_036426071.1 KN motif and ankyrin repeat domain-containing protein 4 isoform X1 [Colossoma macropomum]XP_036426072.1 KN motif and ankyrin repeat domain-containing protein 4 isoform X1 [Colossoma macropomum]XP_036426073.1 KN motif and ankyrin repeat domain-containing protein 4 isoform X1 [Colossoma ma
MMDKKSANGFPSKASESGGQRKQLPYSVETPYGFHLDLDFLKYVDDIEKGNTIKRVHIQRKNRGPKYSTLPRNFSLPGHGARPAAKDTWANTSTLGSKPKSRVTEVQQLFDFRASDGSAGSSSGSSTAGHSKVQSGGYLSSPKPADEVHVQTSYKEQQLGLNVRPHLFRASSMPVNVPHRKASESADEQSPQSQNGSTERLFRPVDGSDRRGSVPQDRASLHQQITAALKRVRELEEQVRTIPELKAQICSLREEREQLLQRIQAQSERKVEPNEKTQPDSQDSTDIPVATQQQEAPSLCQDNVADSKPEIPVAESTAEPQAEGQDLVAQDLAGQEAAKPTVLREEPIPAVVSVPVILIEKAESPTDSEESEKQLEESEHEAEIPERHPEQEQEKQEETLVTSAEDKQSELLEEQGDTSEHTASQEETEKAEAVEGSDVAKEKWISTTEQESLSIQELQVKVKTLEDRLSQAGCELERTNSLLSVQIEENRLKDVMIQELSQKVKESLAVSVEQETTVPLEPVQLPERIVMCDASISTDSKIVFEKAVLTDTEVQPDDGPKQTDLTCSSTQTTTIQMRDIEVSAQVMTAEKVVGVEVAVCDQAVETDVPFSPSDNVHVNTSEPETDGQTIDVRSSTDKENMVQEKLSESIIIESDVAEEYVIVEKTESYIDETLAKENIVVKSMENELAESMNVESVVMESSKVDTSTGQSQQDQKQVGGQDTQPQPQPQPQPPPQPQRPTEPATSPAAIGQVVNRIQGLLNEQWASLGSGNQEGKGEGSQKQPVSKISSIQSHLRGSLSALSAFYSPVQKGGAAKQSGLKSIMKKNDYPDKQGNGGVKKNLKFVGVNGGYETTSSEESSGEENEDEREEEVDSSEPEEQGEEKESAAAQEEAAAAGEQADEAQTKGSECSEEPKDLEASIGPQEEQPVSEFVDKNFMAACHYLKDRMAEVSAPNKEMRQILMVLYQEWFRVSSQKDSQADTVTLYLREVGNQTPTLLRYIVNLADGNGNMALHYSVSHSNFPVVKLLLDTGLCEVDHQNKAGYTAIMLAALTAAEGPEDMEVAQQLLSLGSINARAGQSGQTALMLAASHGRTAMVQVLLECKADVNIQDNDGSTALMCASEHGHSEIAKLLLDTPECDTSLKDKAGHTALSVAIKASHSEVVELLKAHAENAGTSSATGLL